MGEVEFFDRIKKANRYLNNKQRQILLDIIDFGRADAYEIADDGFLSDMPWIEYNKDKENK